MMPGYSLIITVTWHWLEVTSSEWQSYPVLTATLDSIENITTTPEQLLKRRCPWSRTAKYCHSPVVVWSYRWQCGVPKSPAPHLWGRNLHGARTNIMSIQRDLYFTGNTRTKDSINTCQPALVTPLAVWRYNLCVQEKKTRSSIYLHVNNNLATLALRTPPASHRSTTWLCKLSPFLKRHIPLVHYTQLFFLHTCFNVSVRLHANKQLQWHCI